MFLIVEAIKINPAETEKLLREHLTDFTYITSNQLNALFEKLPGTFEEKVGVVQIGDCSTLSLYIAGLLKDAGIRSGIAQGLLETGGKIDGKDYY